MTPAEQVQRGEEAARLLDDPILKAAFRSLEDDAIEAIVAADVSNDEARLLNALRVKAIRDLRDAVRSVITTGKQAASAQQRG